MSNIATLDEFTARQVLMPTPPIQSLQECLVVEDDQILGYLICNILEGLGFSVVLFATADDALMHVLSNPNKVGLIVSDHSVPGQLTGLEFAQMVRSRWATIPILLTSGYAQQDLLERGDIAFIQKPWTAEDLVKAVREILT